MKFIAIVIVLLSGCNLLLGVGDIHVADAAIVADGPPPDVRLPDSSPPIDAQVCSTGQDPNDPTPDWTCESCGEQPGSGAHPGCPMCRIGHYDQGIFKYTDFDGENCCAFSCCWGLSPNWPHCGA